MDLEYGGPKSTVHRARNCGERASRREDRELWNQEIPERLVLHWDGKLLPSLSGDTEDRIAVLLTGEDDANFPFLGVPASSDSTERNVAAVVLKEGTKRASGTRIIAFCFDTTASNTGMVKGACIRIEGRTRTKLALVGLGRHHVHEVILKDVFEASLGSSSGPDIGIFKTDSVIDGPSWVPRRERRWKHRRTPWSSSPPKTLPAAEGRTHWALSEEGLMSKKNPPREDYEELLRLSYLFLGGEGPAKPFRRPGALHQARGMAKAIYCLKLQMLKSQLSLTGREKGPEWNGGPLCCSGVLQAKGMRHRSL
ncbi:hypothetical protein GWK47_025984 [Chionoecetes opilio]|uniref:Uncharacterized protein n=1 Tax=Chionoecetes opilio TaxID=41210 RepID=A0A8J8WMZ5_CHIOP|nr:hypothetical protein GWK47_025984 [Chionoecetes opilio]